ncbi:MAG TPA: F0F1 ATP synthase subunit A [Candidatus Binatia bacterium]|nr:F0F1 ATP synthase subunit A [Candidatus Binatia bacterium]
MEHAFTWVSIIPGLNLLPTHTATATLVMLALIAWALVAVRQMRAAADPIVPDATFTARNTLEVFVEVFSANIVEPLMGHHGRKYVPLYGTFFLFIIAANFCGLLPGFAPPTSNFNVTFALGVTSLVAYTYYGFESAGVGYLKHFAGPIWWLAFLMVPLEIIDNLVRPVSLALRLFGNMTGDHVVLEIFTDLTKVVVPVLFYLLGSMVCVIQAFVFTLLSVIYLSLATAHHDH